MTERKTLIYVYGLGRSGSTLIGQVLGSTHRARTVGEFASFTTLDDLSRSESKDAMNVKDLPCGCGSRTIECEYNPLFRYLQKYELFKVRKWFSNKSVRFPAESEIEDYLKSIKTIYDSYDEEILIDTSKNSRLYHVIKNSGVFSEYDVRGVFVYRNVLEVWKSWGKEKGYLKKKPKLEVLQRIPGQLFWCVFVFLRNWKQDTFINFNSFRSNPQKYIGQFNLNFDLNIQMKNNIIVPEGNFHDVGGNPSKLESIKIIRIR